MQQIKKMDNPTLSREYYSVTDYISKLISANKPESELVEAYNKQMRLADEIFLRHGSEKIKKHICIDPRCDFRKSE